MRFKFKINKSDLYIAEKLFLENNKIKGQYLYSSIFYTIIFSVAFYYILNQIFITLLFSLLSFSLLYIFYNNYFYRIEARSKFKNSDNFHLYTYECEVNNKAILIDYGDYIVKFSLDEINDYYEDENRLIIFNSFVKYIIINKNSIKFNLIN